MSKGYIGWVLFIYLLEGNRGFDIVFEMMLLIQLSQLSPKKRSEMKWKSFSHVQLFATPFSPWNSPGQNTGVGSVSLLQGIFPTQGSNPGLPHCRGILYQLNHKGSPILFWRDFYSRHKVKVPHSPRGGGNMLSTDLPPQTCPCLGQLGQEEREWKPSQTATAVAILFPKLINPLEG